MSSLSVARDAIRAEIKRLAADQARLQKVLADLDGQSGDSPRAAAPKAEKSKRLRLKDDVAADISSKIVKAVKAHKGDGASRKDILTYLARSGYEAGHHFNEPHLNKLVGSLIGGETPELRREGEKAKTRYFTVA